MLKLGVLLTAATVTALVAEFFRRRRFRFPAHGWLGLFALAGFEWLLFRGMEPVTTYFTPLAWTAYILIVDAATAAISGYSRLREEPRGILKMAILSIPLWLIFEAYNLRLANWTYVGLPEALAPRWVGYAWSFATITPAIFLTAAFVESLDWFPALRRPVRVCPAVEAASIVAGALLLVVPLAVPARIGAYLFGMVWLGFIFLLDPINHRLHLPSFTGDLARGSARRLYSFLVAGWICGWLWEFWNYWARGRWLYTFPIFPLGKIFEMPVAGYLGFPFFALECFTMYVTAAWLVSRNRNPEL